MPRTEFQQFPLLMLCLALACLLPACSGPGVDVLDRPVEGNDRSRLLLSASKLSDETKQTLREEGLFKRYRKDREGALGLLRARYLSSASESRRRALAETTLDHAETLIADDYRAALGLYLDAVLLTQQGALASVGRDGEPYDETLYNHAAAKITRILQSYQESDVSTLSVPGGLRDWRLTQSRAHGSVDPRDYDLVVPSSWVKPKGIKWERSYQDGFGAAMVGYRKATPERMEEDFLMPRMGRAIPLNASLQLSGNSARLMLRNIMVSDQATVQGRRVRLAADTSTALAFFYYSKVDLMGKWSAMIRPAKYSDMEGLGSLEPFRDDKIPLVMVHGLMSSAESWLPFIDMLLADPMVREKYQILMFNYPTGGPILTNAADLREALTQLQKEHNPTGNHPMMRQMVILGHSMGGLLSNMQIRDSGENLYDVIFKEDINELNLPAEEMALLRRAAFFKANPDINRAILLAAPLRGSKYASNQIGQFGAWLIRFPLNMVDAVLGDLQTIDALTDIGQQMSERPINSINGLRPDNPILHEALELPVRRGVDIHSIIAQKDPKDPLQESSDGVVPYKSSHLSEAVSEVIVTDVSHRSMVEDERTVAEVLRILYLNAGVAPRSQASAEEDIAPLELVENP